MHYKAQTAGRISQNTCVFTPGKDFATSTKISFNFKGQSGKVTQYGNITGYSSFQSSFAQYIFEPTYMQISPSTYFNDFDFSFEPKGYPSSMPFSSCNVEKICIYSKSESPECPNPVNSTPTYVGAVKCSKENNSRNSWIVFWIVFIVLLVAFAIAFIISCFCCRNLYIKWGWISEKQANDQIDSIDPMPLNQLDSDIPIVYNLPPSCYFPGQYPQPPSVQPEITDPKSIYNV